MTSNILRLDRIYLFMFLDFIVNSRATPQKFVETHHFQVFLSWFRQLHVQYVYLHTTCTAFETMYIFLESKLSTLTAWLCRSISNVYDFTPSNISKLVYNFERLSPKPLCRVMELCTRPCLHSISKEGMWALFACFLEPLSAERGREGVGKPKIAWDDKCDGLSE